MTSIPPPEPGDSGAAGRDRAIAHLQRHRAATVRRVQRLILLDLAARGPGTADRVRDQLDLPPGQDPRVVGASYRPLAEAGLIASDGYEPSRRAVAHCRPLIRWRLADPAAAAAWLAQHPELPEVAGGDAL